MEVVGGGRKDRHRDYKDKRPTYVQARIREYWILDPDEERIIVLTLGCAACELHGEFGRGDTATAVLLPELRVTVNDLLAPNSRATHHSSRQAEASLFCPH